MKLNLNKSLKSSLFGVCLLFLTNLQAQTIKNNLVVMGIVDSVHSTILNETRKVWVYVPASAGNSTYAKQHYPVVYLLDGDGHFPSVTGMIQQLSEINGNSVCPDMIVVGIPNTDRSRDLTPTKVIAAIPTSGGGEKFTDFIEKELMPHIDSIYPTAPYKLFIGHSLGGLMVINTLVNHPAMFNAYIAIDPSMWWDDKKLLNEARVVFKKNNYSGKALFMGIANTMVAGMDTASVRKDTTNRMAHIKSILMLKDILQSDEAANKLKFDYKYYKNDSHGMVPLITEYDALHFLFSFYGLPDAIEAKIFDKDPKFDAVGAVEAHYDEVSKQMGYQVLPPEGIINSYGYALMANMPERAFAFLSMNIRNYPQSFNVYDSMGDYYDSVKNKPKAIEYYKKSLAVKETKESRTKLNKLLADK